MDAWTRLFVGPTSLPAAGLPRSKKTNPRLQQPDPPVTHVSVDLLALFLGVRQARREARVGFQGAPGALGRELKVLPALLPPPPIFP